MLLDLSGPEQIFRVAVKKQVANLGAVVLSRAKGVTVSPRLVIAGDENRLTGFTALPVNDNPYQLYGTVEPVVGAIAPVPGEYDVVFDTPAGAHPGKFTFRVWMNDVTPPTVRLLSRVLDRAGPLKLRVSDAGSGVDPLSILVMVDGSRAHFVFKRGVLSVRSVHLAGGATHRITLVVSDYQEAKNMENVGPILPNTRTFTSTFSIR